MIHKEDFPLTTTLLMCHSLQYTHLSDPDAQMLMQDFCAAGTWPKLKEKSYKLFSVRLRHSIIFCMTLKSEVALYVNIHTLESSEQTLLMMRVGGLWCKRCKLSDVFHKPVERCLCVSLCCIVHTIETGQRKP